MALEARARMRFEDGRLCAGLRDLALAAVRFSASVDRGRLLHLMADHLEPLGAVDAARMILELATEIGHPMQQERARARLVALARISGDELTIRRYGGVAQSHLVSVVRIPSTEPAVLELARAVRRAINRLAPRR